MLKVIQGGKDWSPINLQERRRQLAKIQHTMTARAQGALGPRPGQAILAAALVLVAAWFLVNHFQWAVIAKQQGLHGVVRVAITFSPILAAVASFVLVMTRSRLSRTWTERLFAQLCRYDPVDVGAYRSLQEQARSGALPNELVADWLCQERRAIRQAEGEPVNPETQRFLMRKV